MSQKYQIIIPGSLATIAILSGVIFASSNIYADDVVDGINITVPVSCSLSGTGMNTHNAEINNGQYNSAIGETTIKAFCNDNNGFAIYAIGYTDNTDGKNVLTNSTLGSTYDITTGTATSGNTSNWAMKLSTISSPTPTYPITIQNSFDSFQEVPDDYRLVAKRTSGTDIGTSAEGSTLKSTYQAYISPTQPAGTYTGQVKYTLVHPSDAMPIVPIEPISCPANYICYSPAANDVLGTMNVEDIGVYPNDTSSTIGYQPAYSNGSVKLAPPNYKRPGYGFAGWNTEPDGTGTTYGPSQFITTGNISQAGISLYAKWIRSSGNLQEWNGCSTMIANQAIALKDARDDNVYTVAKLADNNCWMVENLRLNNAASINSNNTNNPVSGFTMPYASSDNWCIDNNEICINQSIFNNNNTNIGGTNASGSNLIVAMGKEYYDDDDDSYMETVSANGSIYQWYSYGNYYNVFLATAGNGTYDLTSGNVSGDICPTGWSLPSGGDNNEFKSLDIALGGTGTYQTSQSAINRWLAYPNNFVLSGDWSGSAAEHRGIRANYLSKTINSNSGIDVLYLYASSYDGSIQFSSASKNGGHSVRCLLKTN